VDWAALAAAVAAIFTAVASLLRTMGLGDKMSAHMARHALESARAARLSQPDPNKLP
jgi:hypothetical protein